MLRSRSGLIKLVLLLPVLVVVFGYLYMLGMSHLEGEERTFLASLSWAAETLTTTGYGGDHFWASPLMVLFVVTVQFIGVFLVFLIIPIALIPFLEERFETRLPREAPDLNGHVVVFGYSAAVASLLQQLQRAGVPTLVVEVDESQARRLQESGQRVILRSLEDGALDGAGLLRARALIVNTTDEESAAIVLAARQHDFEKDVLCLVEEPMHRRPISLAGATAVYTPRHMLGAALAARASRRISPGVSGLDQLGSHVVVREVLVRPDSGLAGKSLAESAIGAKTGAMVIGQWVQGKLIAQPTPEMKLASRGVLVVVGTEENIHRLDELAAGDLALRKEGPFVVCGYGEVGQKVAQLLRDVGEEVTVIDRRELQGVDLVGDVLDTQVLEQAGATTAQAVIVALNSDSATLFATVILKDLAPDVPVIARVNRASNVEHTHRAGADFALSISQVSAQVLAGRLLGEQSVSILPQLKVRRTEVGRLAGRKVSDLDLRHSTGCSVVAVERNGGRIFSPDKDFRFEPGDQLYVCGDGADVDRFPEGA